MERNKKCLRKITKEAGKVPICLQITVSAERKPQSLLAYCMWVRQWGQMSRCAGHQCPFLRREGDIQKPPDVSPVTLWYLLGSGGA